MENNTTHWIYKGSFEMNEMSGRGRMEFSDGAVFEGRFLHN